MPTTKRHARWCRLVVGIFPTPYHTPTTKPHQQRCDFVLGVLFFSLPHMPTMKRHARWCHIVVGVFPRILHPRPPRNHTNKGVISCWVSFFRPTMAHANHEMTRLLVSF